MIESFHINYPEMVVQKSKGLTESEEKLATLGYRTFLQLWSYPNPYKMQDNGQELCDMLEFFAGALANSIAITADAFNNLSDAGSSVITLIGFKMAGQKPDPHHPFGHGRIEYLSGLAVSAAILIMAFELIQTSFTKILDEVV